MKVLTGVYYHGLDSKNRIRIPSKLKAELVGDGEGLHFVQYSPDCIAVMNDTVMEKRFGNFDDLDPTDEDTLNAMRFLMSRIEDVKEDEQGRVVLSKNMRDFIGVDKDNPELVSVGMVNYVEIWSAKKYQEKTKDMTIGKAQQLAMACRAKMAKP